MDNRIQSIKANTDQITFLMTQGYNRELGEEVSGKITEYNSLLATSSTTVALSEMLYNEALGKLAEQFQDSKLSATDKKMIFAGRLKTEIYYMTLADRQNRAITHAIEALRSQLSYIKAEMQTVNN